MNIRLGLERISAVWWGFLALWAAVAIGAGVIETKLELFVGGIAGLVVCYIAHRIACWIIAGFFSP